MVTNEMRIKALAAFVELTEDHVTVVRDENHEFGVTSGDYLVLTDEEADAAVKERILEDVWAFKPEFLINHLNVNDCDRPDTLKSLRKVQECCESCNGLLRAALKDPDDFVRKAVSADGRGRFMSGYDGEENESEADGVTFYLYRTG